MKGLQPTEFAFSMDLRGSWQALLRAGCAESEQEKTRKMLFLRVYFIFRFSIVLKNLSFA